MIVEAMSVHAFTAAVRYVNERGEAVCMVLRQREPGAWECETPGDGWRGQGR